MERELLKRELKIEVNKNYALLSYILFAIAGASLIAYLIIVAVGGYWEQMFDFDDDYMHIFMIAMGFLIPAVIFFLIKDKKITRTIVLTDKRIYAYDVKKQSQVIKSYNLNKINNYTYYQLKKVAVLKSQRHLLALVLKLTKNFITSLLTLSHKKHVII